MEARMPSEKQIEAAAIVIDQAPDGCNAYDIASKALAAAEQAEPAPAARSGAVKVKPLEWAESTHGIFIAKTPVGAYEVGFDDGWWAQLDSASTWEWEPENDPRSYDGPFAAKDAAQADFESRILAALEPAEPATGVEPIWFGFDESTGEFTGEYCTTKPHDTHGMKPFVRLGSHPPESRLRECATEDCNRPATVRFERGGIGSEYCHPCYLKGQALAQGADDERS